MMKKGKALHGSAIAMAVFGLYAVPAVAQTAPPVEPAAQDDPVAAQAEPAAARPAPERRTRPGGVAADGNGAEDILVTGSRLAQGDVTSNVEVITQKDIQARGVTSVEELIRTLPQNVGTIGTLTNDRANGPLANRNVRGAGAVSVIGSLGVAAANLNGLGAGNTLILVNGRRMAGAAGIEDGFVNLNAIPLNAIERVEISAAGASAVYGADAIGGVINFILKRDYRGITLGLTRLQSVADADNTRFNATFGTGWGSGSITLTGTYERREPLNNRKSGFVTEDYSALFGGNQRYNLKSYERGLQPGVVQRPEFTFDRNGNFLTIVSALTPRQPTNSRPALSDFVLLGPQGARDFVPELGGPRVETFSATANITQKITDRLELHLDGLFTRANTSQAVFNRGIALDLAPGQAYNPFPAFFFDNFTRGTRVNYNPQAELDTGLLAPGRTRNTATTYTVNAGLTYSFNADTRLSVLGSRSSSKTDGDLREFGSLVSLTNTPGSPTGVTCFNGQLNGGALPAAEQTRLRAIFDRQCAALTSTDPANAFNPWKATADGSGSSISDFYYTAANAFDNRTSTTTNFEARLNGGLVNLPGGKVYYVVGAEYFDDGVDSREVRALAGAGVGRKRHAFFGEVTIPLVGGDFTLPLVHSLTANVAARRDVYDTEGAVGTVGDVPVDRGGVLIFDKNRFARTTPAYGVRWEPFANLELKGRWTSGFSPPPPTQLFTTTGLRQLTTRITNDPLYTCTTDCDRFSTPARPTYVVPLIFAPNPDLRPQQSRTMLLSAGWHPRGTLDGLRLEAQYNRTRIRDQFASQGTLLNFMPVAETYRFAQFFPRDANGKIIQSRNMIFNSSGSTFESMTYLASYRIATGVGTFEPRITLVDNLKSEQRLNAETPPLSTLGTVQGVDNYRIVGSLSWQYQGLAMTIWGYHTPTYINDYFVIRSAGVVTNPQDLLRVNSLTTFDLTMNWQATSRVQANLAIRNILKASPPFALVDSRPYDAARYDPGGRSVALDVRYSF